MSQALALSHDTQRGARKTLPLALAMGLSIVLLLLQTLSAAARGAPESFADLAEKISPAVVNITTTTTVARNTAPRGVVPEGSPFEDFFREFQDRNNRGNGNGDRPRRSSALGSGFVISEDGFVVTNNHVIEGADEILIEFFEGGELPAKVIGTDPKTDIALLKVEADTPLAFVSFGDSDISRVGDWVMAMGNPLGQGFSVSAGIVSARNRALSGSYDDYIQTDAAINRGNSGGPLFNMDGDVVGVNTAILSPNGGSIGIGFSMASNVVTRVVDPARENPKPGERIYIDVADEEEHATNARVLSWLAQCGGLYAFGDSLVEVEDGQIFRLTEATLRSHITRYVDFSNAGTECPPPKWCYQAIHQAGRWKDIPKLERVVRHPLLRPDGTVMQESGYDEQTATYVWLEEEFPPIPETPTL